MSLNYLSDISQKLKREEVICLATDTIYGLVALANSDKAIKGIYRLKQREIQKPLGLIVANSEMAEQYVFLNDLANKLINYPAFSISVILPKKPNILISNLLNQSSDNLSLRIPKNEILKDLIQKLAMPIAATSTNISGEVAMNDAEMIQKEFNISVFSLVKKMSYLASPIIDLTGERPKIIRSNNQKERSEIEQLICL